MVINLIENTRALIVYVPPKNKFIERLYFFKDRLSALFMNAFSTRKIPLMYLTLLYICGMFFGICLAKDDFTASFIAAELCHRFDFLVCLSLSAFIILLGFTVFGRITSLTFELIVSVFVGVLLYTFSYDSELYVSFILKSTSAIVFSVMFILFSTEVFLFSKRSFIGKNAFPFKACLKYVCISNIFTVLLYILFISIL